MPRAGRLTPFSYVILALVGRDGAGPHDIVRMMREGAIFWTTSESHYYAEPRRLATLGLLQARTEPGRTRPRTHYELTDAGREALTAWLAEPAAMPRVQNEGVVKLLAADFSDDATIVASLAGVRAGIQRAYQDLQEMERRALEIPHRTRYLRLIDDYARRSLDAQREWLDAVAGGARAATVGPTAPPSRCANRTRGTPGEKRRGGPSSPRALYGHSVGALTSRAHVPPQRPLSHMPAPLLVPRLRARRACTWPPMSEALRSSDRCRSSSIDLSLLRAQAQ